MCQYVIARPYHVLLRFSATRVCTLTLIILDTVPLAMVRNFCTLTHVIWSALDGLAGLRIVEDYRPCAANKDNHRSTEWRARRWRSGVGLSLGSIRLRVTTWENRHTLENNQVSGLRVLLPGHSIHAHVFPLVHAVSWTNL